MTADDATDAPDGVAATASAEAEAADAAVRVSAKLGVATTVEGALVRAARPRAQTLSPGTMLDANFRVDREIGRGAMGVVYEVEHVALGKRFAAKVLTQARTADEESILRLQQEARAASAIDHENIVQVTHLGESLDGFVFVVMELLHGIDLAKRIAEARHAGAPSPVSDALTRDVVAQILRGLAAAHEAGIVHRDLKPENVYLAQRRGRTLVKIVDFGISKLQAGSVDAVRLTQTGQMLGTPLYMAPEQTRGGSRDVDGRADLYSLGVIAYEMATGRHPFPTGSLYEILESHASVPPPPPRASRPELPERVEHVILRALAKDPADRYPDAASMLASWEAAWDGFLPADDVPDPALSSSGRSGPASVATATRPPPSARARALRVAAGLAAALGVGGAAYALLPRGAVESAPAVAVPAPSVVAPASSTSAVRAPTGSAPAPSGASEPAAPRRFVVRSSPPGATVHEGDTRLGTEPVSVAVAPGSPRTLRLSRVGHEDTSLVLAHDRPGASDLVVALEKLEERAKRRVIQLAPR